MKNREINIDIIKIIAFLLVITLHSAGTLHMNQYYNHKVLFMTTISSSCNAIFIIISGYLLMPKSNKGITYHKLVYFSMQYVLACIICIAFRNLYYQEDIGLIQSVFLILNYEAAPYGWYFEMYICLFLLSPFFNLLWINLNQKQKKLLLLILVILVPLPVITNIKWNILPDFFVGLYPMFLYYLGAFIHDKSNEIRKIKSWIYLLLLLLFSFIFTLLNIYLNQQGFKLLFKYNWANPASTIIACLIIFFILSLKMTWLQNAKISKYFSLIANCTFIMYLTSYCTDSILGVNAIGRWNILLVSQHYLIIFFILIILSLVLNMLIAFPIYSLSNNFYKQYLHCVSILQRKK